MSGFEIAGVVLGIIPMAIKGYGSMDIFFKRYTGFESQMRRQRKVYIIQQNQFRRSIRALITGFFDDITLEEMIKDADHAQWESDDCREAISTLFDRDTGTSEEYKATVELIQDTLMDIMKLCVLEPTSTFQTDDQSRRSWNKVTDAIFDSKQRFHWAISKKSRLDDLLSELSKDNWNLERLVNQIRGNTKQSAVKFTPRATFESIKKIQSAYTDLYRAVTSACSACNGHTHAVDLALEDEETGAPGQVLGFMPPVYRVMFHDGQESKVWCMRLKHLPTGQKSPPQVKAVQLPIRPGKASVNTKPHSISQDTAVTQSMKTGKKTVHFQKDPTIQPPPPTSPSASSLAMSPASPIQNLCLSLEAFHQLSSESETKYHQLGYLSNSSQSVFEVHLAAIESHPAEVYHSLNQVLSNDHASESITERVLQPYQRWKLAYLLSCSLLRLYSSPWLSERERWASRNVKFFLNRKSGTVDTSITTHAAALGKGKSKEDSSVVDSVKNYQIYALGVLLLELALGKPIDTSLVTSNVGAELKEYLTVMRLDKHGVAARTLGPQYGEIVSRCLSFRFETAKHDLANVELQREFYNDVVCQLEGCLKIMTEPGRSAKKIAHRLVSGLRILISDAPNYNSFMEALENPPEKPPG